MKKLSGVVFVALLLISLSVNSLFAGNESSKQKPIVYYLISLDVGQKWKRSDIPILKNPELKKILRNHSRYMDKMEKNGSLIIGGPFLKDLQSFLQNRVIDGGMLIYRASSLEKAKEIVAQDPIISSGVFVVDYIKPFVTFVGPERLSAKAGQD